MSDITIVAMNIWFCYGCCPRHGGSTDGCCEMQNLVYRDGICNSSHGGSCCVCGGPLPKPHLHLNADNPFNISQQSCGGNVCSEICLMGFQQWLNRPEPERIFDKIEICPGHWK